jgi:hypothetical protein
MLKSFVILRSATLQSLLLKINFFFQPLTRFLKERQKRKKVLVCVVIDDALTPTVLYANAGVDIYQIFLANQNNFNSLV